MEFVEEKLAEWGLAKFIVHFKDNEIEEDSFLLLDDESIKELIKPIGPRLMFKKELQLLKLSRCPNNGGESSSMTDSVDGDVTDSDDGTGCSTGLQTSSSSTSTDIPPAAKKLRKEQTIRNILESTFDGQALLEEMESGLISYKARKKIVATLVSHLIEHHGKHPRTDVKLTMAKSIIEEFPNLDNNNGDGYCAWYTPGSGTHDASGFIKNRLRNVRSRDPSKTRSSVAKSQDTSSSTRLISTVNIDLSTDELSEGDMAAMITWLRYHNSPSSQVQEMMEKTCKFRASKIREEKDKTVLQLLDEYPRLIDTDGMVEQDFRQLFPKVCDNLFLKWPKIFKKIIAYANKQVNWKQLLHFDGILETDDQESNVTLQILPLLFPPGMKKTNSKDGKKGPNKHASVVEACDSFIQFDVIGTNLPSFLENTTKKQPFILGLGERENPEQTFVIVERKALPCGRNVLKAVDVCFKLFYLLDTDYPWESQNTWDFIQKFIFGLGEGKGKQKSVPSVTLLQNFLNKK